jgi:hypothetical protein
LKKENCIKLPTDITKITCSLELFAPNLKNIEDESIFLFKIIVEHLYKLSHKTIHKVFKRFNSVENKISEVIDNFFENEVKNTEFILKNIQKCELTYEFTNDKNFLEKYNNQEIIELKNNETVLRNALNDYYLIIIRSIIPKTIQYKLLIHLQNNL